VSATDFNDLACLKDLEAVRDQIASALANTPEEILDQPSHTRAELAQMIEAESDVDILLKEILPKIAKASLTAAEKHSLRKKLAKKADVTIDSILADEHELLGTPERERETHLEMARRVIASYGSENLLFAFGNFWRWDVRGVWLRINDYEVKGKIL